MDCCNVVDQQPVQSGNNERRGNMLRKNECISSKELMKVELKRLVSFKHIPPEILQRADVTDLARKGFYATSSEDIAKCFSCDTCLHISNGCNMEKWKLWHYCECEFAHGGGDENIPLEKEETEEENEVFVEDGSQDSDCSENINDIENHDDTTCLSYESNEVPSALYAFCVPSRAIESIKQLFGNFFS